MCVCVCRGGGVSFVNASNWGGESEYIFPVGSIYRGVCVYEVTEVVSQNIVMILCVILHHLSQLFHICHINSPFTIITSLLCLCRKPLLIIQCSIVTRTWKPRWTNGSMSNRSMTFWWKRPTRWLDTEYKYTDEDQRHSGFQPLLPDMICTHGWVHLTDC